MLGIGEVDLSKLQVCSTPGYTIVPGRQLNPINGKMRVNVLIKDGLPYQELDMSCEIPTCCIVYGGWTILFLYREWAKGGDQTTKAIPLQNERWETFVSRWLDISGNGIILGDFNYCYINGNTPYQRQFDQIRNSIIDNFVLYGWSQIVQDYTRYQANDTPSLLDQIFVSDHNYVERVYNLSLTGTDHHLVGLRLRHDGQVNARKIIERRNVVDIDVMEFERLILQQNMWEVFNETDVNMAVWRFNVKIGNVLNRLAPKRQVIIRRKNSMWITEEIRQDLETRNELHLRAKITGNQDDWRIYKMARNRL